MQALSKISRLDVPENNSTIQRLLEGSCLEVNPRTLSDEAKKWSSAIVDVCNTSEQKQNGQFQVGNMSLGWVSM